MGGDVLVGTNFVDALKLFEKDAATEAMILVGEVGGHAEEEAASWIQEYRRRTKSPKPIAGLVAGIQAVPGRVMGHAGAFAAPGEANAETKIKALEEAGVQIVNHPAIFGNVMKRLLLTSPEGGRTHTPSGPAMRQQRGVHSLAAGDRKCRLSRSAKTTLYKTSLWPCQRRTIYINQAQAFQLLKMRGVSAQETLAEFSFLLAASIDRSESCPCIIASIKQAGSDIYDNARRFPFDFRAGLNYSLVQKVAEHLHLEASSHSATHSLPMLLRELVHLFISKEAFILETRVGIDEDGGLCVHGARFGFDDAAYTSANRQNEVHKLRNVQDENPDEVEAERHGIVYIKFQGNGNIGTLVNGAGLVMNTNDVLAAHGGKNASFLDTGGKATSETVKTSFRLILKDPRVKVIFVNIFGGLTLCNMIAEGIILAFKDLEMQIPVVVRLRGTNEMLGQKMIAESGPTLHAFDDFEAAAEKVMDLANTS
ncbi:MAG: hypothetical protein M1837_000414 [Sclerophora amabilis]|nr:MAG: hypothetical protein M1837_000414 [Sclerophora amabilis]